MASYAISCTISHYDIMLLLLFNIGLPKDHHFISLFPSLELQYKLTLLSFVLRVSSRDGQCALQTEDERITCRLNYNVFEALSEWR
jgi:hypothetical protein